MKSIKNFFLNFIYIALKISMLIGTLFLFRYLAFKGILGFLIGVSITAYLFMSKNPMLMWIAGLDKREEDRWYINEIAGTNKNGKYLKRKN